MPRSPRSTSAENSPRVNVPCSPVPWISTNDDRLAHDEIGVHAGVTIFQVHQVQPRLRLDYADAHGGDEGAEGRRDARARGEPGTRVRQRHAAAGDAGGAGPAVGLQHVAVDADRVLAERHGAHRRAQRAADQALDLLGPPTRAVPLAAVRSTVARGSIEYSAVTHPSPVPFLNGGTPGSTLRRAVDQRPAHADEARALGVGVRLPLEHEGTELVVGTVVRS